MGDFHSQNSCLFAHIHHASLKNKTFSQVRKIMRAVTVSIHISDEWKNAILHSNKKETSVVVDMNSFDFLTVNSYVTQIIKRHPQQMPSLH
jgi:hypothetical protein